MRKGQLVKKIHLAPQMNHFVFTGIGILILTALVFLSSFHKPSSVQVLIKAVYLVRENGLLPPVELKEHPEVAVTESFAEFQRQAQHEVALWIDKNAVGLVDKSWLTQEPQMYYPLVLLGYNSTLYSFRDVLPLGLFLGPIVDWQTRKLEPGYSVIQREKNPDQTNHPKVTFLQGYVQTPHVEEVLEITNSLLLKKLNSTPSSSSISPSGKVSPTPPSQ